MKALVCENCGANSFFEKDGFRICRYCETKYSILKKELSSTSVINHSRFNSTISPSNDTNISLHDDIQMLLDKCRKEPSNAKRYANRILDIDPSNKEALIYL